MILVLERNHVTLFIFACCFLVVSYGIYNFALHPGLDEWEKEGIIISSVDTDQKVIALTFDDGPDIYATPQVLEVLRLNQVQATFFVLGLHAEKNPPLVREIQFRGHEIGSHGYSHQIAQYDDSDFALSDIKHSLEVITLITGIKPHLFRPPGGFLSRDLVEFCRDEKLIIITWPWQADYQDWKASDANALAQRIVAGVQPGQILLLHDGGENR